MRKLRFIPPVLALLFLPGCIGIHRDRGLTGLPAGCPADTPAMLSARQNTLGPLSDTRTLECAVAVLRGTGDHELLRTSLGSRLCLHLADREADREKREKLAAEGVNFAETALAHGGDGDGAVHYYLAANLGLSVREHVALAMENLGRLEKEMKKALALSPDIDEGGPMRLLGALYLKAPPWPAGIGDLDKALELLEKAVHEHPGHPLNHLFYAQALWADGGDSNLSRVKSEFNLGEKLLVQGQWGYNTAAWKKEFDEFRRELGDALSQ